MLFLEHLQWQFRLRKFTEYRETVNQQNESAKKTKFDRFYLNELTDRAIFYCGELFAGGKAKIKTSVTTKLTNLNLYFRDVKIQKICQLTIQILYRFCIAETFLKVDKMPKKR